VTKETRRKRKYTVSDKVRAANHLNLEKARAVDKKIRYRPTDKRLDASRANLLKARQSPNYKPYVKNGLRAVDLRRSAPQVGETQEEYDRHLELVEQALPAEGERQRNGVRGLAQALWRRRRVFVSRVQRETFSFYLELEKAAGAGLCLDSLQSLEYASRSVFLEGEHPRLEEAVERLDKRLVQVAEAYLTEVRQALVHLGVFGKHPYRAGLLDQPPEVIGNGLVGPREVMRRMQGGRPSGRFISFLAWLRQMTDAKSNLLKVFMQAGNRLPDPRRAEDFALQLRLIEAAFFGDRHARFGLADVAPAFRPADADLKVGATSDCQVSSLDDRVAEVKRLHPELYQAVYNMAEATWERLQVFARQAEKEAKDLRHKLEQAAKGTLRPGKKALKHLWWKVRDQRLAQNPLDFIYQVLWAKFLEALKKAKAERRKAERRNKKAEIRSQESEAGSESKIGDSKFKIEEPRNPNPETRIPNGGLEARAPGPGQSSIDNRRSSIPEFRIPNPRSPIPSPESQVPSPGSSPIQGLVERLIGVFLCSWTYAAFVAAKESNRRVEEAFRTLEGAVEATARSDESKGKGGMGKKGKRWGTSKEGKGKKREERKGKRAKRGKRGKG